MTVPVPKDCKTCAHRIGRWPFAKCQFTGSYCETERKFPTRCGDEYDGWLPRPGLLQRIRMWLFGCVND